MTQLEALRKQGCYIWVEHRRLPKESVRRRMNVDDIIAATERGFFRHPTDGAAISPVAGLTRVKVWLPKDDQPANEGDPDFEGVAICSAKDQFVKRIGFDIAFGRVRKRMYEMGRLPPIPEE
jgi:hypothetical protein